MINSNRPSILPSRVGNLISVKVAAELVGMSPQTIRNLIKDGDLEGFRIKKGPWRVDPDELLDLVQPARPASSGGAA
ncbi:helix-turn-helix domain-containing protein [Nocardia sp. NPDC004722]